MHLLVQFSAMIDDLWHFAFISVTVVRIRHGLMSSKNVSARSHHWNIKEHTPQEVPWWK